VWNSLPHSFRAGTLTFTNATRGTVHHSLSLYAITVRRTPCFWLCFAVIYWPLTLEAFNVTYLLLCMGIKKVAQSCSEQFKDVAMSVL